MAVSYSGYTTHKQCGLKFKYRYVDRLPVKEQPRSPAADRGTAVHNAVEAYFKEGSPLPPEVKKYAHRLWLVKEQTRCEAEKEWAFKSNWSPCAFDAEDGWLRGKVDLWSETDDALIIYEFKTGRMYPDHDEQRALYGLTGLLTTPKRKVTVIGLYFDLGEEVQSFYDLDSLAAYKWLWTKRINDTADPLSHIPHPGRHCKWCPYAKGEGGPCAFG
jgi:hypothetical protein